MPNVGSTEVWYHALYHVIGHFAAYVVMLAALVNIAFIVATIHPIGDLLHRVRAAVMGGATLLALTGALYFMNAMGKYAAQVNARLPPEYLKTIMTFPHSLAVTIGFLVAILLASLDFWLIWFFLRTKSSGESPQGQA